MLHTNLLSSPAVSSDFIHEPSVLADGFIGFVPSESHPSGFLCPRETGWGSGEDTTTQLSALSRALRPGWWKKNKIRKREIKKRKEGDLSWKSHLVA
jgi:hypothetical protein